MRPNRLRALLKEGKPAIGTMIQEFGSPATAIILANAGFDFLFIDMEHGSFSIETAANLIKTIRLTGVTCLVRVSDNEYSFISRILDAGAEGIMVPRVESRQEAEYIVQCARYPPIGKRGCSTTKGHTDYQKADPARLVQEANRENLIILQIERKQAVDHIDEILAVPGVDVALIGPLDLSLSLGTALDFQNAEFRSAIDRVVRASQACGVYSGMHTSNLEALFEWHRQGMQVLTYSSDIDMLSASAAQKSASLRKGIQERDDPNG